MVPWLQLEFELRHALAQVFELEPETQIHFLIYFHAALQPYARIVNGHGILNFMTLAFAVFNGA